MDISHDSSKKYTGRHYAVLLVVLLGCTFSAIIFMLVNDWEEQQLQARFREITQENTFRIRDQIGDYITELDAIKRFFNSSRYVDRQEFRNFVKPVLDHYPEIQALEWVPRVPHALRRQYVQKANEEGFFRFRFTERNPAKKLVTAAVRDTYYPVYYLEPLTGNRAAFGFDLGSSKDRLNALQTARDGGSPFASRPIHLVQDTRPQNGFLIFNPVYANAQISSTEASRRNNLLGFILGVFRVRDVIDSAIPQHLAKDINILVYDETKTNSKTLIYQNNQDISNRENHSALFSSISQNRGRFRNDTQVSVAGRNWRVVFVAGPGYSALTQLWQSWLALIISLLITAWLAQYVRSNQRRTSIISSLVEQRSQELQASEAYNHTIFNAMSEGLITCTSDGVIDTFNPAAEGLYGYTADEVTGKDINILVPDKYIDYYGKAFHDYLKTGHSRIIQDTNEFRGKRKDGSIFDIEYSISRMRHQEKTKYIITVHDISDRKAAEDNLRKNADTLERLHNIATQTSLSLEQKAHRILELGLSHLDLSLGIISHIEDDRYTVMYSVGKNAINPGTEFPLQDTYCSLTLQAQGPVGFHNETIKRNHVPKHRDKFDLAAYISAPFYVGDQYYGTLNFSSTHPRSQAFTQQDFTLINILAQWVGSEISRDIASKEINRFSNLFESLFRDTPEPIALANLEREFLMVNPAFSNVFGYAPEEIIGKQTLVVYANKDAYEEQGRLRYNPGTAITPKPYEMQYLRKSGEIFPAETVSTMLKDNNNDTIGFLVHIRDISERRQAEVRLAKQAREAQLLHQGTTIAAETSSLLEALQRCIDMVCDIMEWPVGNVYVPDEANKAAIPADIWHVDNPNEHEQLIRSLQNNPLSRGQGLCGKVWQTGTATWIENIDEDPALAHLHKIQKSVNCAIGFPIYVDHSIVAILGFYTYNTLPPDYDLLRVLQILGEQIGHVFEKRRAEKAITDAEERARLILESAGEGIYGVDLNGRAIFVNPAAENMIGYSAEELVGKRIHDFIHHSHADGTPRPDTESHIHQVFSDGEIQGVSDDVIWRKDGSYFPAEYTSMPMWKNGKIVGAVVTFSDISERLKMDRMKSEFVATVSHELRTPLTSIRGSLGLLAGGVAGELPEKAQIMVEIANKNSERLLLLINDILDMEKINSGKMEFHLCDTELTPLIENAIESSYAYARQFGANFRFNAHAENLMLNIDSDRFLQVMSNLLSNAAKFSPPNEYIDISVDIVNRRQVQAYNSIRQIRISVTDRGPGIPEEFQDRIFEKFCQADASDSRQKGGTGLGLSITKNIVERMNGTIGFVTAAGKGTTFYVDFPEATGAAQHKAQRRSS